MNPEAYAAELIDLCATSPVVDDFDVDIRDNLVVRARVSLMKGFIDIYRNFKTGTTAFAWVVDDRRIFGVDNTGGGIPILLRTRKPMNLREPWKSAFFSRWWRGCLAIWPTETILPGGSRGQGTRVRRLNGGSGS